MTLNLATQITKKPITQPACYRFKWAYIG